MHNIQPHPKSDFVQWKIEFHFILNFLTTNSLVQFENFTEFDHKYNHMYTAEIVVWMQLLIRNLHAKEVCAQWLSFSP